MLPFDLETRTDEHLNALRREATSHRHTRHLGWRHTLAIALRALAERLEPQLNGHRHIHPAR